MISNAQIRSARALLNLDQKDITEATGININQISAFERGAAGLSVKNINKLSEFFVSSGIEFLECDGVRRRQEYIKRYKGSDGFKKFMDVVYQTASNQGGEFCIYNASPSKWSEIVDDEWNKMHVDRMTKVAGNINFKITCPYGYKELIGSSYAQYKWIPKDKWSERSFYVFDDYIAILIFKEGTIEIILFREKAVASTFLELFNIAWDTIAIEPNE